MLSAFLRIKQTLQHSKEGFKRPIKRSACPLSFHNCLKEPSFLVFVGLLTLTGGEHKEEKMPKLSAAKSKKSQQVKRMPPKTDRGAVEVSQNWARRQYLLNSAVGKWEPRQGLAQPLSAKARSSKHHFHILVVSSQMLKLSRAAGLPL